MCRELLRHSASCTKVQHLERQVTNIPSRACHRQRDGPSVTSVTCDCPTFTMLPCKHVFIARLHCSMCLFDKALIHDRWLRSVKCASDVSGSVTLTQKSKKKAKRLTKSAKFTQMQTLCKEIAGVCSEHSMEKYAKELDQLKEIFSQWSSARNIHVMLLNDEDTAEAIVSTQRVHAMVYHQEMCVIHEIFLRAHACTPMSARQITT